MELTEDLLKRMVESINPGHGDFSLKVPAMSIKYASTPTRRAKISPEIELQRAREEAGELTKAVTQQGNYVRELKKSGAPKSEVQAAVQVLLSLKDMLSGRPSAEGESFLPIQS